MRGCLGEEVVVAAARVWREEDGIEEKEGGGRVRKGAHKVTGVVSSLRAGARVAFGRHDCGWLPSSVWTVGLQKVQEGAEVQESRLDR